jgi:hypothetical protein
MPETTQTLSREWPKITAKTSLDELVSAISAIPTPESPDSSTAALENPAVARCCHAYTQALKAATQQGKDRFARTADAGRAYRQAMPPLSGHENIRDFIACVAHAMLIDAISGSDGARLLYAAQVAHATHRAPSSRRRISPESSHIAIEKAEKP